MTFREFQRKVEQKNDLTPKEMLENTLFGLSVEVGKISGLHQQRYQKKPMNVQTLRKKIGKTLTWLCALCDVYNFDLGFIAEEEANRAGKRYPIGFEPDKSLHRAEGDV